MTILDAGRKRSLRWEGYDYRRAGAYFVTICCWRKQKIFGRCEGGTMRLSARGRIAHEQWVRSEQVRTEIELGEFIIMPNHMHGIICLKETDSPRGPLGAVVGGYKSTVTRLVRQDPRYHHTRIWQRGYWDRVIRSYQEYVDTRAYILNNPRLWHADPDFC